MAGFDGILSNEATEKRFCSWFWSGSNGNDLINALNSNNRNAAGSKIRRLSNWWPHVYGVVFNEVDNPGKSRNGKIQWKYCKVGITEVDTTTGTGNQMEIIKNKIQKKTGKNASIVFVLQVKATDSRPNKEIEESVRKHFGWKVDKELARANKFPVPTEWVITTQPFIDLICSKIDEKQSINETIDTGLFNADLKFRQTEDALPLGLTKREDMVYMESDN